MQTGNDHCEWCSGMGLITAYHRQFDGGATVMTEVVGRRGEVITVPMPGTIAIHCTCGLGLWIRDRVDAEDRRRIPTLSEVIGGRSHYLLERPDLEDDSELSPAAKRFIRSWRDGFGGQPVPAATKGDPIEMSNALRARTARLEAERGVPA